MGEELKMVETEGPTCVWSPKRELLFHSRDEVKWPDTPHSHPDEDEHNGKRSVFARVKDKAKRWKNSFSKKKHGRFEAANSTAQGISLLEEAEEDEDPEFYGAPMYQSKTALPCPGGTESPKTPCGSPAASPHTHKHQPAGGQPCKESLNTSKNEKEIIGAPTAAPDTLKSYSSDGRTLTQSVTEMLTPAYNMVLSSATQAITCIIRSPTEAASVHDELGAKLACDKDVSVKEYLMEKLKPGEDDKVLSQVITETISTRKTGGNEEDSVVEKLRGVVSSLLGMEEINGSSTVRGEVLASMASPKEIVSFSEASIPVSTNPCSAGEAGGRQLEAHCS